MIKSWINNNIVWLEVEGEFLADELINETNRWLHTRSNDYIGYLVDIRKMTKQTVAEQKKAEAQAKKNNSGKPRAVLGKDIGMAMLVNIYIRFTGAEGIRYFTNTDEAIKWLNVGAQSKASSPAKAIS